MDSETVDLAIKGAVGLIVVTATQRFFKKLDSLEATLKDVSGGLIGVKKVITRDRYRMRRFERLIEMLRKRDHKFFGFLQEIRWHGETINNWKFEEPWDMPFLKDDEAADERQDRDDDEDDEDDKETLK